MNLYEGAYRGDRDDQEEPRTLLSVGLTLAGLIFLVGAVFPLPSGIHTLIRGNLDPGETFEHFLVSWILGWSGLLFMGWGICEFLCTTPGPRILFSLICAIPILAPFGFLGHGSSIEAWSAALTAEWLLRTGQLLDEPLPFSPLFIKVLTWLHSLGGWTAVFTVHLMAGIGAVLVWLLLPDEIVIWRRRLIALGILLHPLFLVSCATGLDPVWQVVTVSVSVVFLVRGLISEEWSYHNYLLSGLLLGLAAGFHWSCLVFLPVWILTTAMFEATPSRKMMGMLLIVLAAGLTWAASLALGSGGIGFHLIAVPDLFFDIPHLGYHLLHDVFPPPLLVLLLVAVWRLRRDWDDLEGSEQILCGLSLGGLIGGTLVFGVFHESAGPMNVLIPMSAVLTGLLVPRGYLAIGFPILALWGVLSVPILPAHPAQEVSLQLKPVRGLLVDEASKRFDQIRGAQQLLLASQKRNTVYVVGGQWPLLATIHPDWILERGILRNPEYPVEFRDWVDQDTFRALRLEEFRFYVVGDAGRINREKFGYDLFEEGATAWEP